VQRLAITSLALALTSSGAAAAAAAAAVPASNPRPSVQAASIAPIALSAAAYVAIASSIDLFQVKAAQLALERSQNPANRAFAERMLSAHMGTSQQLNYAGRRLNLLPSATLDPQHQAMLDALAAASDFDNAYRAQENIVLEEGLKLHSSYAKSGGSPTLRPVAANAENVMRANLKALRGSQ
jgi:putative membrane protein